MPPSSSVILRDRSSLARFGIGFGYPMRGVRHLIDTPRLWTYVVVPVFLTVVMIGGAGWLAWTQGPALLELAWTQPGGEGALATTLLVLWHVALVLARLALFLVGTLVFYGVGGVVAIPFNDFLSQAVEESVLGSRSEPFTWGLFFADLRMSLSHSLLGLALYVVVMVPVLLLNLVPVVGSVVAATLGGLATTVFLAREMIDGPLSRDRITFANKVGVLRQQKALMIGFGSATACMLWVPGLNLISIPCAVVGGTLLYCQLKVEDQLPTPRPRGP